VALGSKQEMEFYVFRLEDDTGDIKLSDIKETAWFQGGRFRRERYVFG
jgi:hypothetical protein